MRCAIQHIDGVQSDHHAQKLYIMNTPKGRQDWIYEKLMKDPTLNFVSCFSIFNEKFSKTEQTFNKDWKKAVSRYKEYQKGAQKLKEEVRIEQEKESAKNGLKSKLERVLLLQEQVDAVVEQIAEGTTSDLRFVKGKPKQYKRAMSSYEINDCRKTLRALQSEISKIEGDYSASKHEISTTQPILSDSLYLKAKELAQQGRAN